MNDLELARAYDRYSDALLEESYQTQYALAHFSEEAKDEDSREHAVLTEYLSNDGMFWLAIGAGASYLDIRDAAIYDIVVNQGFYSEQRAECYAC